MLVENNNVKQCAKEKFDFLVARYIIYQLLLRFYSGNCTLSRGDKYTLVFSVAELLMGVLLMLLLDPLFFLFGKLHAKMLMVEALLITENVKNHATI